VVTVVNLQTRAVQYVPVGGLIGSGPFEVALNADGKRAYIAIPSAQVAVIDTATNAVVGCFPVQARAVAITADESQMYLANSVTRQISVVSLVDNSTITHTVSQSCEAAQGTLESLNTHILNPYGAMDC
jgi:DNA-binding beta-propeller fold protein YncE